MATSDGLALTKAFMGISDAKLRRTNIIKIIGKKRSLRISKALAG